MESVNSRRQASSCIILLPAWSIIELYPRHSLKRYHIDSSSISVQSFTAMNPLPPPVGVCNIDSTSQSPPTDVAIDISTEWLDENGLFRGRPVDVAVMKDGSLLISDDFAGALYRVTYNAP